VTAIQTCEVLLLGATEDHSPTGGTVCLKLAVIDYNSLLRILGTALNDARKKFAN